MKMRDLRPPPGVNRFSWILDTAHAVRQARHAQARASRFTEADWAAMAKHDDAQDDVDRLRLKRMNEKQRGSATTKKVSA